MTTANARATARAAPQRNDCTLEFRTLPHAHATYRSSAGRGAGDTPGGARRDKCPISGGQSSTKPPCAKAARQAAKCPVRGETSAAPRSLLGLRGPRAGIPCRRYVDRHAPTGSALCSIAALSDDRRIGVPGDPPDRADPDVPLAPCVLVSAGELRERGGAWTFGIGG